MKKIVIALGGNAISREFEEGNIHEQFANTRRALVPVVQLIKQGHRICLTHGNGPQAGNMLIRVEESRHRVPPIPLGVIVADLQGGMGYMIQQTLQNKLHARGINKQVVALVTQMLVNLDDPSILNPTKFVGPVFSKEQIAELIETRGWQVREDVGRGWRRVVPSPLPIELVEREVVVSLFESGVILLACGGGGIPVFRDRTGKLEGVDAVIDKDLSAAVLAKALVADALYILTSINQVAIHFATPLQQNISKMTLQQARQWLAEGHFPAGSMGPKIQAAIHFLQAGGKEVIITSTEQLIPALQGKSGTRIYKE